jgi:hypothetical protein
MRRLVLLILALPAVLATAAIAAVAAPKAETGSATNIAADRATLNATVNPNGSATTVHFDLGTGTAYGVQTAPKDIGAGTADAPVEIPVQGLAPSTTYHFRAVATNEGGTTRGADHTFRTAAAAPTPAPPTVRTGSASAVTTTGATLTATVDPNRQPTAYRFDYGPTTSYGQTTGTLDAGSGDAAITARARVDGLRPGTRYHYRVVATNATGTARGGDRSFTTSRSPTGATLEAAMNPVPYGDPATLRGKLVGPRMSGIRVALQTTPFPFDMPFQDALSPVVTGASGTYSFVLPRLAQTTRAIVIADGRLLSPVVTIRSAARVGILSVRRSGVRLVVRGRVRPATPNGVVSVQRRGRSGRFARVSRAKVGSDGLYEVTIRATRRPSEIRVVGLPRDGGAHVPGTSRERRVAARR